MTGDCSTTYLIRPIPALILTVANQISRYTFIVVTFDICVITGYGC